MRLLCEGTAFLFSFLDNCVFYLIGYYYHGYYLFLQAQEELAEAKGIYDVINSELLSDLPTLHNRCVGRAILMI